LQPPGFGLSVSTAPGHHTSSLGCAHGDRSDDSLSTFRLTSTESGKSAHASDRQGSHRTQMDGLSLAVETSTRQTLVYGIPSSKPFAVMGPWARKGVEDRRMDVSRRMKMTGAVPR
jgi:hypothetical protein